MNRSQLLPATLLALVAVSIAQSIQNHSLVAQNQFLVAQSQSLVAQSQSLLAGFEGVNNQPKVQDELKVWTPEGKGYSRVVFPVTERIKILGIFCGYYSLALVEIDANGDAGLSLANWDALERMQSEGVLIVEPTMFGRSVGVSFELADIGRGRGMGRMVYQTMRSSEI